MPRYLKLKQNLGVLLLFLALSNWGGLVLKLVHDFTVPGWSFHEHVPAHPIVARNQDLFKPGSRHSSIPSQSNTQGSAIVSSWPRTDRCARAVFSCFASLGHQMMVVVDVDV